MAEVRQHDECQQCQRHTKERQRESLPPLEVNTCCGNQPHKAHTGPDKFSFGIEVRSSVISVSFGHTRAVHHEDAETKQAEKCKCQPWVDAAGQANGTPHTRPHVSNPPLPVQTSALALRNP